jgi:hypothetical protein
MRRGRFRRLKPGNAVNTDGIVARRSELVRLQNARIAAAARAHHFGSHSPVPFVCECDDGECHEFVTLTLPEYEAHRERRASLLAPGHATAPTDRTAAG